MAWTAAALLLAVVAAVAVVGVRGDGPPSQRLPNVAYLGSGYDALIGNPQNMNNELSFRERVFQLGFATGAHTADNRWITPDYTSSLVYPECDFEAESTLMTSSYQYRKEAQSYISSSDSKFFHWFASSRSAEFTAIEEFTSQHSAYELHLKAHCSVYKVGYDTFQRQPTLDPIFVEAVGTLPAVFNPLSAPNRQAFREFLTTFGTHAISTVEMGGRADQMYTVAVAAFQNFVSQQIDVNAQAKIGFLISLGGSAHGEEKTSAYVSFSSNSSAEDVGCQGGDPSLCAATVGQNASFGEWSKTVVTNPLPKAFTLVRLNELLTPANFPNASNLAATRFALNLAIDAYFVSHGILSYDNVADVAQVANHAVPLSHDAGQLPSLLQIFFTPHPQANRSVLYTLESSVHYCQTNTTAKPPQPECASTTSANPGGVAADSASAQLGVAQALPQLRSAYNAETGSWTDFANGYWTVRGTGAAPSFESGWVRDWAGAAHATALAGKGAAISNQTAFMQVWFATELMPSVAYPLIWRQTAESSGNPVSIQVLNGSVVLHVNTSTSLFSVTQPDASVQPYESGFWRAAAFDAPPNGTFYDSGFFELSTIAGQFQHFKDLQHGMGATPEVVQVWFSPVGSMDNAFLLSYIYQGGQRGNPATVEVDNENILLHFVDHTPDMFVSFWETGKGWVQYSTTEAMYWRVVALASISDLNQA